MTEQTEATTMPPPRSSMRILIVTCDLPSHPYAAAKLAKVYASAGHHVTLASPDGPALDRCQEETEQLSNNIRCIAVGTVPTKKHMNERPVTNPFSWKALFDSIKNPFPTAHQVNVMFDEQDAMYIPLKEAIVLNGGYDLVITIHSTLPTVADAIESIEIETGKKMPPLAVFSSLPYDAGVCMGELNVWNHPRSLTTFPHVSTYPALPPKNPFRLVVQRFWQLLDAWLTSREWSRSAAQNNARRARRGLGPIQNGWQGYFQKYPSLWFGGVFPYLDSESPISEKATVIGSLDSCPTPLDGQLKSWLEAQNKAKQGIVYASFGTGTKLSDKEATALVGDMVRSINSSTQHATLVALRSSEQKRLRDVLDATVGCSPTSESERHLEYLGGRLRIQADVPQSSLLSSGHVRVFISHMGMGGFVEGATAGVPIIAYPSGLDQFFNAQRAVEAGIAVQAPYALENIGDLVAQVLNDKEMQARARNVAHQVSSSVNGAERALSFLDRLTSTTTPDETSASFTEEGLKVSTKPGAFSLLSMVLSTTRQRRSKTLLAKAA